MRAGIMRLAVAAAAAGLATSSADCGAWGFDAEKLACATCSRLAAAVEASAQGDAAAELAQVCEQCCAVADADGDDAAAAAAMLAGDADVVSAELVVDKFRISAFPDVANFLSDKSAQFGRALVVTDRFTRWPELILRNGDGDAVRRIEIRGWETHQIEEFLAHKLASGK